MTITEKYGFKVSVDQFGNSVSQNFVDSSEQKIIEVFERELLLLRNSKKTDYSMVELGSNQAYYSLLFKHLLGKDKTANIMVEPFIDHFNKGKQQFELNSVTGIWYNRGIGKIRGGGLLNTGSNSGVPSITLSEILLDNKLPLIDCLHCDIDGQEMLMLTENEDLFKQEKINLIFLFTHDGHSQNLIIHNFCKEFFNSKNYDLVYEDTITISDRSLVYRLKKSNLCLTCCIY